MAVTHVLQYKTGVGTPPPFLPAIIKTIAGGGSVDRGYGIEVDSSNNIIFTGSANNRPYVRVWDSSGTTQWQRGLEAQFWDNTSSATDASGNVYAGGFKLAKYNSSGVTQWHRQLQGMNRIYGIDTDSSGNVYISGTASFVVTSTSDIVVAKFDSSGNQLWQRAFGNNLAMTQHVAGNALVVDGSGNVYVTGINNNDNCFIVKYNTSGTLQWHKELSAAATISFRGLVADSSGNVIVAGSNRVAKLAASDGSIVWQRRAVSMSIFDVGIDGNDDPYIAGSNNNNGAIVKLNSSGTTQWSTVLDKTVGTGVIQEFNAIDVDSAGNVHVGGHTQTATNYDLLICRFAGDGSGAGAYTNGGTTFTLSVGTIALDTSDPLTIGNTAYTFATSSQSVSTSLQTETTPTFPETTYI